MKHIIDPANHKLIIVAVAAIISFAGFQAASLALESNEPGSFILISALVYIFLVFWQSFIFDLHLKHAYTWSGWEKSLWRALQERFAYMFEKQHFLHYQNYLILPTVIYWSAVALLFLNPFETLLKQIFASTSALGLAVTFWYLKTVFYDHKDARLNVRQLIFVDKLLASYLAFAAVFGLARYFGFDVLGFAMAIFGVSYILIHQAFFQHHYIGHKTVEIILLAGLVTAESAGVIFAIWNVNFYSGALVISAVYNTIWGIIQHKYIDRNLTREIVYEYLAVLFVILVIVFSTTNFSQRI